MTIKNQINMIRIIYNSDSPIGKTIKYALDLFTEHLIDETVSATEEVIKVVSKITRSPQLRWRNVSAKLDVMCPSCNRKMKSLCSLHKCYVCGEESMLHSNVLRHICEDSCSSFRSKCDGPDDISLPGPKVMLKHRYSSASDKS